VNLTAGRSKDRFIQRLPRAGVAIERGDGVLDQCDARVAARPSAS